MIVVNVYKSLYLENLKSRFLMWSSQIFFDILLEIPSLETSVCPIQGIGQKKFFKHCC